jgi:hypothetical protein
MTLSPLRASCPTQKKKKNKKRKKKKKKKKKEEIMKKKKERKKERKKRELVGGWRWMALPFARSLRQDASFYFFFFPHFLSFSVVCFFVTSKA